MRAKWRRNWLVAVLGMAVVAVLGVHLAVNWWTAEPPNFTRIDEGLWLGGYVAAPPRGTTAVLNLCETSDPYQVTIHRWQPIADAPPAPSRTGSANRSSSSKLSESLGRRCSSTAATG
jgi:hypothetical protein